MTNKEITISFNIAITVTGIVSSIISISAGWGYIGIGLAIISSFSIIILRFWTLRQIMNKNDRGITLLQALDNVGLIDIENRKSYAAQTQLPPDNFYKKADNEIVITGISVYRTFDQHFEIIKNSLEQGKKIYILILHPEAEINRKIFDVEGHDIVNDINGVITKINKNKIYQNPAFKIRFRYSLPTFTAVMIDGDLEKTGKNPRDKNGIIRVQITSPYRSQHKGIILEFKKKQKPPYGGFTFFANDLRNQWLQDGKDCPNFFK